GNCHCGAIKFTVDVPDALAPEGSRHILRCSCSICTKNGYFLLHVPVGDVHFVDSSWDKMKIYRFGSKTIDHRFCGECGSSVCIDLQNIPIEQMKGKIAIN
ncbi:hypothetical protein BAUCODRAFT_55553, partial [Baudoinia panamericana UAMH 10762]